MISKVFFSFFSAMLAVVGAGFFLRRGIILTPDGWAYWEGAVSLMSGNGYRYFGGQPITAFPPLFSLLIASFQVIFGVSGRTLVLVVLTLAGLTAGIWTYLFVGLCNRGYDRRGVFIRALLALFIAVSVAQWYDALWSESLFIPIFGLLNMVLFRTAGIGPVQCGMVALLLSLCVLSRNVGLAYVAPVALMAGWRARAPGIWRSAAVVGMVATIPFFVWGVTRLRLRQTHEASTISLGAAFIQRSSEAILGFGELAGGNRYGIGIALAAVVSVLFGFILVQSRNAWSLPVCSLLLVSILGFACMLSMMVLVSTDPMGGRFLWVTFLAVICSGLTYSSWVDGRSIHRVFLYALVIVVVLQVLRLGSYAFQDVSGATPPPNVRMKHFISPTYVYGPDRDMGGATLIQPESFEWIDRKWNRRNVAPLEQ